MVIFSCATSAAAAAHDFLWEETKRFGSLQKPVQHFYLEVQLNYQGAFAYLSLLKVNYLFWQYTVFENHQKCLNRIFALKMANIAYVDSTLNVNASLALS